MSARPADLSPKTRRKQIEENGSAGRDRQPRGDSRSKVRIEPPPSDPPKPLSQITQDMRAMLNDPLWITMRDQICYAHQTNNLLSLKQLCMIALSFKSGANANSGSRRLIGHLMVLLMADLNNGLDTNTPAEFNTRYWS